MLVVVETWFELASMDREKLNKLVGGMIFAKRKSVVLSIDNF